MLTQTSIPQPRPQVSLLATLKVIFGAEQAEKMWRELAANPGRDIVADVHPKVFEMINIMRTKPV